ncbi:hypothetical protein MTR67_004428 [Solanum verrucosum]|uniref:Uncharacterized protein n=1 Tax=Solanum verrucosum TaxID=315347 RepID=A0AAF0PUH1_SOLVR|nr:hypothetical protein MTR67_004428 [Solanum verrucosum]
MFLAEGAFPFLWNKSSVSHATSMFYYDSGNRKKDTGMYQLPHNLNMKRKGTLH